MQLTVNIMWAVHSIILELQALGKSVNHSFAACVCSITWPIFKKMRNLSMISTSVLVWMIQEVANAREYNTFACSFQTGSFRSSRPDKCGYQRGWDGMLRANWKITKTSRDKKITNRGGYFAYFEARSRPAGYSSRFISPTVTVYDDTCITFSYVNKGIRAPYPKGRSSLQVYFAPNGRPLREDDEPLWSSSERSSRKRWKKAEVPISKSNLGGKLRGSLVFVAVRGGSKRAYIAVDDISVHPCKDTAMIETPAKRIPFLEEPAKRVETTGTETSDPLDVLRTLAAHRPVLTRKFSLPPGALYDPENPASLPPNPRRNRDKKRSRGHKRRKSKGGKKSKEFGVVYITDQPGQSTQKEPFVPTLVAQARPDILCDFTQYTQGLQKCLRAYFSMLKQHRSRSKCNAHYFELEKCLQTAATKCVPTLDMSKEQVEELVSDTLRNKFKTQQVYCFEEGAFVYPEFSLGTTPLQCTREYFGKLTQCGGMFSGLFNFKHGDPGLCKEYFTANECQRQTTAQECDFDTRSMLIYGLNLQYQFAHNPFCIDLPFSAWWPNE